MYAPRTIRNKWFRDEDGVLTKAVDSEESLIDQVDFTDELRTNEAISAATWDDVSSVTLGTPTISAGVVEYTHTGVGSAVLQVALDFSAYLETLFTDGGTTAMSVGGGAKSAGVVVSVLNGTTPWIDLVNCFVRFVATSGAFINIGPLSATADPTIFEGPLLENLSAADNVHAPTDPKVFASADDYAAYVAYLALPTKTIRTALQFVDPLTSSDDYT